MSPRGPIGGMSQYAGRPQHITCHIVCGTVRTLLYLRVVAEGDLGPISDRFE